MVRFTRKSKDLLIGFSGGARCWQEAARHRSSRRQGVGRRRHGRPERRSCHLISPATSSQAIRQGVGDGDRRRADQLHVGRVQRRGERGGHHHCGRLIVHSRSHLCEGVARTRTGTCRASWGCRRTPRGRISDRRSTKVARTRPSATGSSAAHSQGPPRQRPARQPQKRGTNITSRLPHADNDLAAGDRQQHGECECHCSARGSGRGSGAGHCPPPDRVIWRMLSSTALKPERRQFTSSTPSTSRTSLARSAIASASSMIRCAAAPGSRCRRCRRAGRRGRRLVAAR